MAKKINITESKLIKLIEHEMRNQMRDVDIDDIDIDDEDEDYDDDYESSYEVEDEEILSPDEIIGLMEDQIVQLQSRVDYSEELLADVLEFTSALMEDLGKSDELNLRRSKQKLRALETRSGREIFWLKSRRL
jgi:hypothetical protein|tara:strand:- start:951 stop:1349 length:399 start_codon:yes stop_codon:yes gene_type:complete